MLALGAAGCAPAAPRTAPADPPGAVADARSPFPSAYRAQMLAAANDLKRQIDADCLAPRFLRVPAEAAAGVRDHYARALGAGWQESRLTTRDGETATVFRDGDAVFAPTALRASQPQGTGIVIVTNLYWNPDSRAVQARCLGVPSS